MKTCKDKNLLITGHLEGNDHSGYKSVINSSIVDKGNRDFNIFVALFLCLIPFNLSYLFKVKNEGNVYLL